MSKPTRAELPPDVAAAAAKRIFERPAVYTPWHDLSTRTGVEMRWHVGSIGEWHRPWGVTDFEELSVTLRADLSELKLRCTLAHELIHLDRGPFPAERTKAEEAKVDLITGQRLIDPVLLDILRDYLDSPRTRTQFLRVDGRTLRSYMSWRTKVQMRTAMKRWEEVAPDRLPEWPARWITFDRAPLAHAFAAARLKGIQQGER